ncbi:hypothetical protein EIN_435350 [Entamoeba invadens IP1]|uniref:CCHC-type domain-containing protein n=1 Tax=Entamoeba invadens IP1 TaxID=370355 RepID=A0A0A1U3D0_ENTIV|nr:hypothetical protein EIN_435350 [Entamoeba invadens IP1]ELP88629.1 hypothetical protein EIN_435350 [Entamoeba invadens IP1]|eukprot:XP_004255400.1 hypothetical protein EIN_435350 [Entamoeba invadens IP1]
MTDDAIHALFDKYSPISYDNPRYEKENVLDFCKLLMKNKNSAKSLVKRKNGSEWDGVKLTLSVQKRHSSGYIVNFIYKGLDKSEEDVKEYLKGYNVLSVERLIQKKGNLMKHYVSVVFKDIESVNQAIQDFKTNEETKKYRFGFITKTGDLTENCFICGKFGHLKDDCPEADKAVPKVEEQKEKKADDIKETQVPQVTEPKEKKKNGVKREKHVTIEKAQKDKKADKKKEKQNKKK